MDIHISLLERLGFISAYPAASALRPLPQGLGPKDRGLDKALKINCERMMLVDKPFKQVSFLGVSELWIAWVPIAMYLQPDNSPLKTMDFQPWELVVKVRTFRQSSSTHLDLCWKKNGLQELSQSQSSNHHSASLPRNVDYGPFSTRLCYFLSCWWFIFGFPCGFVGGAAQRLPFCFIALALSDDAAGPDAIWPACGVTWRDRPPKCLDDEGLVETSTGSGQQPTWTRGMKRAKEREKVVSNWCG